MQTQAILAQTILIPTSLAHTISVRTSFITPHGFKTALAHAVLSQARNARLYNQVFSHFGSSHFDRNFPVVARPLLEKRREFESLIGCKPFLIPSWHCVVHILVALPCAFRSAHTHGFLAEAHLSAACPAKMKAFRTGRRFGV